MIAGISSDTIKRVGPGYDPATGKWTIIKNNDHVYELQGHNDFEINLPGIDLSAATLTVGARSLVLGRFDGRGEFVQIGDAWYARVEWPASATKDATPGSD